jgi:hypothetical protein
MTILARIGPHLKPKRNSRSALSEDRKLALYLTYVRAGSAFQKLIGSSKHNDVAQSTTSVRVAEVAHVLASLKDEFVRLPSPEEAEGMVRRFYEHSGLRGNQATVNTCAVCCRNEMFCFPRLCRLCRRVLHQHQEAPQKLRDPPRGVLQQERVLLPEHAGIHRRG